MVKSKLETEQDTKMFFGHINEINLTKKPKNSNITLHVAGTTTFTYTFVSGL